MKTQRNKVLIKVLLFCIPCIFILSCEDLVEEGYRINYADSDAAFSAEPLAYASGAAGDMVSFKLTVNSKQDILSCVVEATNEGASGSGYDVSTEGFDDPFVDHNYGTIQEGTRTFVVKYDYIIPENIYESKITFSIVDEMGKVSEVVKVKSVPAISIYNGKSLYARNDLFYDAFASINGQVYDDIKSNYSTVSAENLDVQEEIDVIFFHDEGGNRSVIAAPNDGQVSLGMQVENATLFMKMEEISEEDFLSISPASLVALTEDDSISYYGSSSVSGFAVGDVIGFTTDVNALHSLKTGLLRVNGLHPANVDHYEGTVYVMECDIVTQTD